MGQLRQQPSHFKDNDAESGGLGGSKSAVEGDDESITADNKANTSGARFESSKTDSVKGRKSSGRPERKEAANGGVTGAEAGKGRAKHGGGRNGRPPAPNGVSNEGSKTLGGAEKAGKANGASEASVREVSHKAGLRAAAREGSRSSADSTTEINDASAEGKEPLARDFPFRKTDSPFGNRKFRASGRRWDRFPAQAYLHRFKSWANQDPKILRAREMICQTQQKIYPIANWIFAKASFTTKQMQNKLEPLVRRTWPIVKAWLASFVRVFLMLALLSLECGSRGLDSIFRLGLAAIFLVLWCTAVNLLILSGFLSFCIAMGLSIAAAFFLGYIIALAILTLYAAAILWLYGSFWTTVAVIAVAGGIFLAQQTKVAFYMIMVYAVYSTISNGGWLGMLLCACLACVSSDVASHFMSNYEKNKRGAQEKGSSSYGKTKSAGSQSHDHKTKSAYAQSSSDGNDPIHNSGPHHTYGEASTSGVSENDALTPEEEVARLLACRDHYSVLGLAPFDDIDITILKREYRKKAMLVHPDKNRGNDEAEEAFKRLQNAYEILLDDTKRKSYDDDLRREELLRNLRQHFANHGVLNQRFHFGDSGRQHSEQEAGMDIPLDAKQLSCKTCNNSHIWLPTNKSKQRARWCQDCQDYHPAKNGDGWVEQSGHSFIFGIFQRVDLPRAYACSENRIYDVTDWVSCQGLKCAPNTHKASFSVSTASSVKPSARTGARIPKDGVHPNMPDGFHIPNVNENMTEKEFFDWLENAMASGVFPDANDVPGTTTEKTSSKAKQLNRKKKKPKKQW